MTSYNREQSCYIGHEANGDNELPKNISYNLLKNIGCQVFIENDLVYYAYTEDDMWEIVVTNYRSHVNTKLRYTRLQRGKLLLGDTVITG